MPSSCDVDGECFDFLSRFELAGLKQITPEPILRESDENDENGLRAD